MKNKLITILLCVLTVLIAVGIMTAAPAEATQELTPYVTTETTTAESVLAAIETSSYIQLGADMELTLSGQQVRIDLAGYNLIVNGNGKLNAFDTANDTFDHLKCGIITAGDDIAVESVYVAPNGNRYVALTSGAYTTMHRLDMQIKTVTLRTSSAGLYYNAVYQCDRQVEERVTGYGVAVSLQDVPGEDFKTAAGDAYTVATEAFTSGVTVNSGSVVNIMSPEQSGADNLSRSKMRIYANAYIDLGNGPVMADAASVGKTAKDADFSGTAVSLLAVMRALDGKYDSLDVTTQKQLDAFAVQWITKGVNWKFENIGNGAAIDWDTFNADLVFDAGTTKAYCPVCQEKVTWIPMTDTKNTTTAADGAHYYLPADLVFDNDNEKPFMYAPGSNQEACFHLNGHDITSLNWRVFHSGSGRLNIMGNGTVAGYNKKSVHGAAIHTASKSATSEFVLYGGTYAKVPGTPYVAGVIYVSASGGNLTVYDDVVIQADANGKAAIYTSTNNYRECNITLHGCTVNGTIYMEDATNDTNLTMLGTTVKGNITIRKNNNVTLSGKVSLTRLTINDDSRVALKSLDPEAYVKINAKGAFTTENGSVAKYLDCFVPYNSGDKVFVKNNVLHCGQDYTANLEFAEGTTDAWCPVCKKTATWTEIVAGDTSVTMANGGHYYLAEDQHYTGGGTTFLSFSNGAKVCVHLNGHNLTSHVRALYTGTGTTNIMGTGVVSGAPYDTKTYGAALHHNSKSGVINLYSGTYRQTEGGADHGYTLNMHGAGGTLNVFPDATVEGSDNGKAIRTGNASGANIAVTITDATINGNIYMVGATTPDTYTVSMTLDGARVNGTVNADGTNHITLVHDTRMDMLDLEDTSKVTLDRLLDGAHITVKNPGAFAVAHENASEYQKYFTTSWIHDSIAAVDGVLTYKVNYTSDLLLDARNQAMCPACRKIVTWTAFTDDTKEHTFTEGGHFYLAKDLTYTGDATFLTTGNGESLTCLHLNGHNITTTNSYTMFISSGALNVMGSGVVMGKTTNSARGTVMYSNNKNETHIVNLFSGTYTKYDSTTGVPVIAIGSNGGDITVYEDAVLDAPSTGLAVHMGNAANSNSSFRLVGATVKGDITVPGAANDTYAVTLEAVNGTITGDVKVSGAANVTFCGRTKIGKLIPKVGETVNFENLLSGSSVKVSADGVFSSYMAEADEWLQYFSTSDSGDWLIVRDKTFCQETKKGLTAAEQTEIESLLAAYADRIPRYGEAHNHSASGPVGGADGYKTIEEWRAGMLQQKMDFATIVDHRQSSHMYVEDWNNDQVTFLGGTETGTDITDLPDGKNNIHMNLIFSDITKFEELINSGHPQFTNVAEAPEGWSGYTFKAGACSKQDIRELVALVQEKGGFFAHVHPKYDGYVDSEDPLDYYFGDYTGIEVMCATSSKSDSRKDWNVRAYDLWVDLLELDKKVYATYGNDDHNAPTTYSLTTFYTATKSGDEYMQYMRAGDFTPGWVGVRMQVGDTLMGGTTDFIGKKLVIAASDMFADKYDASHKYVIQLYDDGGILLESELDPSQMNYYALDADPEAKFYRVLIWDMTVGAHVAVGNPIWNG